MNQGFIIRNYHPHDFNAFYLLVKEARKAKISDYVSSREFLAKNLQRPRFNPQKDLFLAEGRNGLIGFLEINPEPEIKRAILDGAVHPLHRKKGGGSLLLEHGLQRARQLKTTTVHCNLPQHHQEAGRLISRYGFQPVRRFWDMIANLSQESTCFMQDKEPFSPLEIKHLNRGEEKILADLQNRCFTGSWGFQPNTAEDINFRLDLYRSSPDNILLAYLEGEPIAYCWTLKNPHKGIGHVLMLGVTPGLRNRGTGKFILEAGLNHLKKHQVRTVELTVDLSNQAALKLYRSFGFKKKQETTWHERFLT